MFWLVDNMKKYRN